MNSTEVGINSTPVMGCLMTNDVYNARSILATSSSEFIIYKLDALEKAGLTQLDRLPYSIRVLLESILRQVNGHTITEAHVQALSKWKPTSEDRPDVPFQPARVVMQDFTGVPAVVDLAAMRSSLARLGGDPELITPQIPVDLVIDHSLQVDFFASSEALLRNAEIEFQRNRERYEFLRWSKEAFNNFRVVPPATGIVHQVNLEYLAGVVLTRETAAGVVAFPDSVVGTDSHTTMINGLGVLGWGVGGIEAEAAIVGQPIVLVAPDVVGFRLEGALPEGTTATDLVLTITQILRNHGVVGKFVEFFGPGLSEMTLPDRATIANMAPEYGATVGFFPVDEETLRYLKLSGRNDDQIDLVERYCKEQGLFRREGAADPSYSEILELDLGSVETSLAGPKRPQDRIPLKRMKKAFQEVLIAPTKEGGLELDPAETDRRVTLSSNGSEFEIGHGAVVIAAITSCTNTSNPSVMVGAGLLAKKAIEKGLQVKPYVKTSLAPGSAVVTEYLQEGGLLEPLAELGFNVVGFGCTTCIGNSGPLPADVVKAISQANLVVSAVLSGNRNFEGRINPHVRANYIASPPLVVAYALAGTTDIDLVTDPIGHSASGDPVYLHEIWPSQTEIQDVIEHSLSPEMFRAKYGDVFTGNETWNSIPVSSSKMYPWDSQSTYIHEPPFFKELTAEIPSIQEIRNARVLALLGDSVTTDHISPAGAIPADGPAGRYLIEQGVQPRDFNSFGSRRGNDRVMTRGTFGNIRLKNLLVPGIEGGVTIHLPDKNQMSIYDAAMKYREEGVPLIVLGGSEYGSGSSRDWAAKGTLLLGVKAVIVQSYERIHRSNLIGMGVLPLQYLPGESAESLGLSGHEVFDILDLGDDLQPGQTLDVHAKTEDGEVIKFKVLLRIDTPVEIEYYRNGGILHTVIRQMLEESS
jgi:aconitate hydratase